MVIKSTFLFDKVIGKGRQKQVQERVIIKIFSLNYDLDLSSFLD